MSTEKRIVSMIEGYLNETKNMCDETSSIYTLRMSRAYGMIDALSIMSGKEYAISDGKVISRTRSAR